MKISQVKSNLKEIITNLRQLQAYRDGLAGGDLSDLSSEIVKIEKCKQKVNDAFTSLESERLERMATQLKRRKSHRAHRSEKLKLAKKRAKSSISGQCELSSTSHVPEKQPLTALNKKELRSARKYLAMVDSLETLHQLRGGGNSCKINESLNRIRSIWRSTAHKIQEQQNSTSIETQWNQILFGGNSETEVKSTRRDLIERRCIWDSYVVQGKDSTGSYIPIGWVYPKEDASVEWKQFQQI